MKERLSDRKKRIAEYKDRVMGYYDVITEPYRRFWGEYFHPAIFDNPHQSLGEALDATHSRFIGDAKLNSESRVLDLGCGIGSLSFLISEKTGCEVLGINLNDFQLKKANGLLKKHTRARVSFKKADIMDLPSLTQDFDAAFLIDVGCHLPDKEKALLEIFRVLNLGGRLVVADWLQKDKPNSLEKELLIEPFNEYWNYPYLESFGGYKKMFRRIGFTIIRAEDVSEKIKKNVTIFYDVAIAEIQKMNRYRMLRYIANPSLFLKNPKKYGRIAKNQFYAHIFTKVNFDAGVFRYGYFVLEKQASLKK